MIVEFCLKCNSTPCVCRHAWECVRCHRINAPHVDRCDCPAVGATPTKFDAFGTACPPPDTLTTGGSA